MNRPSTNPRPSVHLHIERVVLDGLELGPGEAARFEAALIGELARHFADAPARGWSSSALVHLQAAPIQAESIQPTPDLPAAVAHSVFASLSPVAFAAPRGSTEPGT